MEINKINTITKELVETARESLVSGIFILASMIFSVFFFGYSMLSMAQKIKLC